MSGYLIVDVTKIRDEKTYAEYRHGVPGSLAAAGGRYLVRGGAVQVLEGNWQPGRLVVVEFDSARAAREWWASQEYAALRTQRQASTEANMIVVEGMPRTGGE